MAIQLNSVIYKSCTNAYGFNAANLVIVSAMCVFVSEQQRDSDAAGLSYRTVGLASSCAEKCCSTSVGSRSCWSAAISLSASAGSGTARRPSVSVSAAGWRGRGGGWGVGVGGWGGGGGGERCGIEGRGEGGGGGRLGAGGEGWRDSTELAIMAEVAYIHI